MARETKRRSNGRRSPWAAAALIGIGLLITGGVYAGASAAMAASTETAVTSALTVEDGKKLFQANCATCHGLDLQGVGDRSVPVRRRRARRRVPGRHRPHAAAGDGARRHRRSPLQFTEEQVSRDGRLRAVDGARSRPSPNEETLDGEGDVARGAELFRINCAMCHNVAAAGGALTEGKYAPALGQTSALHMYAAMVTGPQNMPVFNDLTLTAEDKRDIISSLLFLQENESPGGFSLGNLGPVSEGLFIWIFGIGGLIAITVWITAKSN